MHVKEMVLHSSITVQFPQMIFGLIQFIWKKAVNLINNLNHFLESANPLFFPLYHFHPPTNTEVFICNFQYEMTITYF